MFSLYLKSTSFWTRKRSPLRSRSGFEPERLIQKLFDAQKVFYTIKKMMLSLFPRGTSSWTRRRFSPRLRNGVEPRLKRRKFLGAQEAFFAVEKAFFDFLMLVVLHTGGEMCGTQFLNKIIMLKTICSGCILKVI